MTTTTMPGLVIAPVIDARDTAKVYPARSTQPAGVAPRSKVDHAEAHGDPFHDPLLGFIGFMIALVVVLNLALGGLYFWGVQYQSPSWNNHSYPAPLVH